MYVAIRLAGIALLFICTIIVLKAFSVDFRRSTYALLIGASIVAFVVLAFLPVENGFVAFKSPHSAFQYYIGSRDEIELVVEGEQCDLVVDRNGVTETCLIVPKTSDGWKIGIGSDTRRIQQSFLDKIQVLVYQYKNTNEYFIIILDTGGGTVKISADVDIEFETLERYDSYLEKNFISYYAYVPNFHSQVIKVNDIVINRTGDGSAS